MRAPRPLWLVRMGRGRGRLYGLDACSARGLLIAGDTRGCLHLGDARAGAAVGSHQVHKKGNKARAARLRDALPPARLRSLAQAAVRSASVAGVCSLCAADGVALAPAPRRQLAAQARQGGRDACAALAARRASGKQEQCA